MKSKKHDSSGRAEILQSMDNCTKCGICTAACPVAAVTHDFPGPKVTGPQVQRFRYAETGIEISPSLCTGCGICSSVCPNDVAISDLITLAKDDANGHEHSNVIGQKLLNRPNLIGQLGGLAPPLTNALLANRPTRIVGEKLLGIHRDAPLPQIQGRKFDRWFAARKQPDGQVVYFFIGCSVGNFDAETGIAVVRLLNLLGLRVEIPTNLCCSLPKLSNGEMESARGDAQKLVNALHPSASSGQPILSSSTSCSLTLRKKYAADLDMKDVHSSTVANAVQDICEYLLRNHQEALRKLVRPLKAKVLYHGPCQLRGHQMGQPAFELLGLIPGIELQASNVECCGIGGTFGYDKNKHEISKQIGNSITERAAHYQPDTIVCDSETCRWHIEERTSVETIHPTVLLMQAIGS